MKKFLSLLLAVICLLLSSCGEKTVKKERFTDYSFDYFDTVTTIIGHETDKEKFDANCAEIKVKLGEYHKLFDIYTKYANVSNLAVVNESETALKVDKRIIEMLEFSKEMYKKTNGKVNVAMGSVLSIWHNYRTEGLNSPNDAKIPTKSELLNAANHIDINNLEIDKNSSTVLLKDKEMSLDVGAIAKGYAIEKTAVFMEEIGISGYLLNVGGNVRIIGKRPDGKKWQVGIENPDTTDKENPYSEYLSIEDISLVTSGSYQRFYTVDGKNYHHIINPETLMPSEYFESVSVLTKSSAIADAFSTALFTMEFEEGRALIENTPDTEALWITKDGEKKYSSGFKKYCTEIQNTP